ncbi:Matrix metallopeptidase-9 (M10 family) [Fasciola gigantica]|uniref:Matrix metallopeptidase-9 (M10 family) n=1 Tax=Fasciola gigantica TaxID=46835 RepID=A0A504Z180_FASGI|nr:Matrix metallopeptidase-9 (M10 family) [Fasciola gigantica]
MVNLWSVSLIILFFFCPIECWDRGQPSTRSDLSREKACVFPSVHRRAAIYECVHSSLSVPNDNFHSKKPIWWCPLTDNFDHYPEWIPCPETASTYAGNQPGQECHFPFLYKKQVYSTCIRNGDELVYSQSEDPVPVDTGLSGYWWCSTTADFDRDRKWTRCRPQLAQQLPCHFPKHSTWTGGMISGIAYECQAFSGHWICMTELGQLRECPGNRNSKYTITSPNTEGGNSPGSPCHFPFQATLLLLTKQLTWTGPARKRNFTTCLPGTPNSPLSGVVYPPWIGYWCATTENFDRDRLWTRCSVEPLQLPASTTSATTNLINLPPSTTASLAAVWTQLAWFQQLSVEERHGLLTRTHAFSPEFERSLRLVESKRAQWDVPQSDAHPSWWIWLAPFWWAAYGANQTPVTTTPPNQYFTESSSNRLDMRSTNPLTHGFQLPSWVDSWSSAGWLEFGLSMNDRWQKLVASVQQRWHKAWLIAYGTGFASAMGLLLLIVLTLLLCLGDTRRKQLVHTVCRPKKLKRSLSTLPATLNESNYIVCTPRNGTGPPKYPCTVSQEYVSARRMHLDSVEPEMNKKTKLSQSEENCLLTDSPIWYAINPNMDILPRNRNSPRPTERENSLENELGSEAVVPKINRFHSPESTCPCWPNRDLTCLCYQQQLNHALELIVNLIRTNENLDELCKSTDLRAKLHQLLSTRSVSGTAGSTRLSQLQLVNDKSSVCDFNASHESFFTDRVIPSAPPPSYEQVMD